jgi:NAD(P)-dependent dehydrogenase (short-subunit alcohol dehydrogenase family)
MLRQDIQPDSDCRGSIVNVVEFGPPILQAEDPVAAAVANAVIGMSKTDSFDYIPDKIRVNCVAASEVLNADPEAKQRPGVFSLRKGRPEDVASAAIWLSSPASSWVTGMIMAVDGGSHLNSFW